MKGSKLGKYNQLWETNELYISYLFHILNTHSESLLELLTAFVFIATKLIISFLNPNVSVILLHQVGLPILAVSAFQQFSSPVISVLASYFFFSVLSSWEHHLD